jgi:two-component system response regulator NreC
LILPQPAPRDRRPAAEPSPHDHLRLVVAHCGDTACAHVRETLGSVPGWRIASTCDHHRSAARVARGSAADVVVIDPVGETGRPDLASLGDIQSWSPETRIVVLTAQADPGFARATLTLGALAYVLKPAARTTLVAAIAQAARRRVYVDPGLRVAPGEPPRGLSTRQLHILRLLAPGYTNRETAGVLQLSPRTVESERARLARATRRTTRADLVAYAREAGLVPEFPPLRVHAS